MQESANLGGRTYPESPDSPARKRRKLLEACERAVDPSDRWIIRQIRRDGYLVGLRHHSGINQSRIDIMNARLDSAGFSERLVVKAEGAELHLE